MFIKSIRGRLLLWIAFLLACILTGFGVTAYQLQRINRLKQIDDELVKRAAALSADVRDNGPPGEPPDGPPAGPPPDEDFGPGPPQHGPPGSFDRPRPQSRGPRTRTIRLSAQTRELFNEADTNGFYFGFWSRDKDLLRRSTNAPVTLKIPESRPPGTAYLTQTHGDFREAYHYTEMGECALVGRNLATDFAALRAFAGWLMVAGGVVLALGLVGSGWLVSHALRPVEKISAAASRISAGNLAERINVTDTDSELGQLAGVLNSTFARLDATFAQQARFTADAAHELRTPVSVMLTHTQNGLASECKSEEHREAFEACQRAAQRMRKLIESLLELARLDASLETIKRQSFDLAGAAGECAELVQPLARERGVTIHTDLAPCPCNGNPDRLAQVIINLLTNAIHYNKPGGEVRLSTRCENNNSVLTVSDNGLGIAPEHLPHIFDRFYRADSARTSSQGRTGLGLAISKTIIEAHGGKIEVRSQPGNGSEFRITLISMVI